ncbi:MAG: glycoside hydrolase family 97 protein [Pseudomonadota bacterium]
MFHISRVTWFWLVSVAFVWSAAADDLVPAGPLEVASPDGAIVYEVSVTSLGQPQYAIRHRDGTVVEPSLLGLRFADSEHFDRGLSIAERSRKTHDEAWQLPWGERINMREHYNELHVEFHTSEGAPRRLGLRIRVFNDGVGFRYELPEQAAYDTVRIVDELTEFRLPGNPTAWWIPARGWNRYEYLYKETGLDEIDRVHTPFTLRYENGLHVSMHEAALVDYAAMVLDQKRAGLFKADLTPWSDGIRVKTAAPFVSPWRTLQIATSATGLVNSDLILNLNEPNALGDVSWVAPSKYIGIWWAMHIRTRTWGSGDIHGATTEETKAYMDFAAEHGFKGVLVEGWNLGWDGDWFHNGDVFNFTQPYPDFDIKAIAEHGKAKGVRLIGHHETSGNVSNYEAQMADALDFYASHGVREIKTGYVADGGGIKRVDQDGRAHYEWHDGQFMVNHYLRSVTEAAKRRIAINAHEPIKDTGLRRTYPNAMAREGARGMEYSAWGQPPNPPEHTAVLPYTRMLSGPMDFTPGIFDLTFQGEDSDQRVESTLARQLAFYVVIYSPLQMAADLPENYLKFADAFQFIKDVPADWQDSRALAGEIGEYIVMARRDRNSADWYLGAITDASPRRVEVALDFLAPDKRYEAQVYRDGVDAHYLASPYDYVIERIEVDAGDTLALNLAAGGGTAVRFVPAR